MSLPPLVKGSSTYKLVVPEKVEEKIRYLIRKYPHTEWSGVLFYAHQGTFETNDLTITCRDIFPMDLGTAGWTEFHMSEDVTSYMAQNIELFDCETGLVHSHHTLGAFFSGQDNLMLQQEGNDTNCFVSLVVDTRGSYVARITRRVVAKSEVTIHNLGSSYEFFGEGSRTIGRDDTESTKTIDKKFIEYFDLEVERHEVPNSLAYLDSRFEEIEKNKKSACSIPSKDKSLDQRFFVNKLIQKINSHNTCEPKQLNLFTEDSLPAKEAPSSADFSMDCPDWDWSPDPKRVHEAVVHILTCNLILNPDKIDLKQWVTRHMSNVYKRIFGEESIYEGERNCCGPFGEWVDFILQYTLDYFDYENLPDSLSDNFEWAQCIVATAIMDEIAEYSGVNPYIQAYCDSLSYYQMNQ